jgi:peptidoglycan biosynthesis protein MviN/MurJ (putative lipid II flippase)
MKESVRLVPVVLDWVIIAGSMFLIFYAFYKRRIRTRWAKFLLVASGLLGVATHVLSFLLDMQWLVFGWRTNYGVHMYLSFAHGLIVGWLSMLLFSGQLSGRKRDLKEAISSSGNDQAMKQAEFRRVIYRTQGDGQG